MRIWSSSCITFAKSLFHTFSRHNLNICPSAIDLRFRSTYAHYLSVLQQYQYFYHRLHLVSYVITVLASEWRTHTCVCVCVRARRLQLKDLSTVWIAVCLLAFLTHTLCTLPGNDLLQKLMRFEIVNSTKNGAIVSCVGQREQFAKMKFSGRVGQVSIISQKQETLSMYLSEHDTSSWFQGRTLS